MKHRNSHFTYLTLFLCLSLLFSCNPKTKDVDTIQLMGYEYYPIKKGNFIIYQISYSSTPDTNITYQIKEVIGDTIKVGDQIQYKLERYQRSSGLQSWPEFPSRIWTVTNTNNKIIKSEDNIPYVKLVFPLKVDNTWNGNNYNTYASHTYEIKEVGKPYNQFSETVRVVQGSEDSTLLRKNYRVEVFAKNIGLVYKQYDDFIYQQGTELGKYKRGNGSTRYIEKFVESGSL